MESLASEFHKAAQNEVYAQIQQRLGLADRDELLFDIRSIFVQHVPAFFESDFWQSTLSKCMPTSNLDADDIEKRQAIKQIGQGLVEALLDSFAINFYAMQIVTDVGASQSSSFEQQAKESWLSTSSMLQGNHVANEYLLQLHQDIGFNKWGALSVGGCAILGAVGIARKIAKTYPELENLKFYACVKPEYRGCQSDEHAETEFERIGDYWQTLELNLADL